MASFTCLKKRDGRLRHPTDVVGIELGAELPQGAPVVRLQRVGEGTRLAAAAFLPLPAPFPLTMHTIAEDKTVTWQLPRTFRAPDAALVVNTPQTYLQYSVTKGKEQAVPDHNYRTLSCQPAPELPVFTVGMPEYQAAWAAQLLPEGARPTAISLQVWQTAQLNLFMASPDFHASKGDAVVIFVERSRTLIAAFIKRQLTLYQVNQVGHESVITAICEQMNLPYDLAVSVLHDNLIDPIPLIEPVLRPLARQIVFAVDYLGGRSNAKTKSIYVYGVKEAREQWRAIFARQTDLSLTFCDPLAGLEIAKGVAEALPQLTDESELFVPAIGAALAVLEDYE